MTTQRPKYAYARIARYWRRYFQQDKIRAALCDHFDAPLVRNLGWHLRVGLLELLTPGEQMRPGVDREESAREQRQALLLFLALLVPTLLTIAAARLVRRLARGQVAACCRLRPRRHWWVEPYEPEPDPAAFANFWAAWDSLPAQPA